MANDEGERLRLSKAHGVPPGRILMSLTDLCDMLGLTRNPVMAKVEQGLPYLERGSQQKPRRPWVFDSAAVIKWLEDQARQKGHEQAMRKGAGTSGVTGAPSSGGPAEGEDIVDYRTRIAIMHEKEIKAATAAKHVVRVGDVVHVFTAHLADASNTLQSVKGRVMAYLDKLGVPLVESERIVGAVIDDACAKFKGANPLRSPLDVTSDDDDPADDAAAPDPDPTPADDGDDPPDDGDDDDAGA